MKRRISQVVIGAITFISALACSTPASADYYRDINRLARRIDSNAAAIASVSRNFQYSPYYHSLVSETQQLRRFAGHIRDVAREGCDLPHLQHDVLTLGASYRRLESRFSYIERSEPNCNKVRRVRRHLTNIQTDIHQMLTCLNHLMIPVCPLSQFSSPYGVVPVLPGWGTSNIQQPGFGYQGGYSNTHSYRNGMGHVSGHGSALGNNNFHVRQPNVGQMQQQALQRSAELDRQLRDRRLNVNPETRNLTIGNGSSQLTFSF